VGPWDGAAGSVIVMGGSSKNNQFLPLLELRGLIYPLESTGNYRNKTVCHQTVKFAELNAANPMFSICSSYACAFALLTP